MPRIVMPGKIPILCTQILSDHDVGPPLVLGALYGVFWAPY